jgi:hypothetical protein
MVNSPPPGPALQRPPRRFFAEDLLGGRVNLDGYPFRYICVTPSRSGMTGNVRAFGSSTMQLVDYVLSASSCWRRTAGSWSPLSRAECWRTCGGAEGAPGRRRPNRRLRRTGY